MGPLIARIFLWLMSGVILYDSIRELNKLFALSLSPYLAGMLLIPIFVFYEYMMRKGSIEQQALSAGRPVEGKSHKVFTVISWALVISVVICLLLVVIMLWAGVIYKMARGRIPAL